MRGYRTGAGAIIFQRSFSRKREGRLSLPNEDFKRCFRKKIGRASSENLTYDSSIDSDTLTPIVVAVNKGWKTIAPTPVPTEVNGLSLRCYEDQTVQTVLLTLPFGVVHSNNNNKRTHGTRELAGGSGHVNGHMHKIWCAMTPCIVRHSYRATRASFESGFLDSRMSVHAERHVYRRMSTRSFHGHHFRCASLRHLSEKIGSEIRPKGRRGV